MNQLIDESESEYRCYECNAYGDFDDFFEYADPGADINYCYDCWYNVKIEYSGAYDDELFHILAQGSSIGRLKTYRLYLTTVIKEHLDDDDYECRLTETDKKIMNETKRLEIIENKRKEYLN